MTTPPGLFEQSLHYRALGLATYGFVAPRDLTVTTLPSASLTARTYGPGNDYTGGVYDASGKLQEALVRPMSGERDLRPVDPPEIDPTALTAATTIDTGYYGGSLFPSLGHFLVETLGRLWLWLDFASRGRTRDERVKIVFHHWPDLSLADIFANRLYRALFGALGIRPADIQLVQDRPLKARILHCPYPLSIYHHYMHPLMSDLFDHLAREVVAPGRGAPSYLPLALGRVVRSAARDPRRGRAGSPQDRIFLSRSRWMENKRILNEDELEDVFRARGFSIVHPQDLSPVDLMRRLGAADIAASSDGSTAHLLAFCRPGTRMLLLDTRPVPTQFALDKLRGFRSFHVQLFDNGCFDPATGLLDVKSELAPTIRHVLETDAF